MREPLHLITEVIAFDVGHIHGEEKTLKRRVSLHNNLCRFHRTSRKVLRGEILAIVTSVLVAFTEGS